MISILILEVAIMIMIAKVTRKRQNNKFWILIQKRMMMLKIKTMRRRSKDPLYRLKIIRRKMKKRSQKIKKIRR